MIKNIKLGICLAALCCVAMTSCEKDNDPVIVTVKLNQTQIEYDSEGVWREVATNSPVVSHGFVFNHEGEDSPWGLIWQGFTPSRSSDQTVWTGEWPSHTFHVMTGGGMSGEGTPFLVCFWNNAETDDMTPDDRSCQVYYAGDDMGLGKLPFKPVSVYVNNSSYTYYTILEGDTWAKKFDAGDYLKLIAHGVRADGSESTASFYLADCSGENRDEWFVNEWTKFDLSSLGEVTDVYFTMESTDVGQWGMNTPAFFCLDSFAAEVTLLEE